MIDCILSGIGLLASFLSFEARKRISAREAMRNPYFDSLGSGVALLKDSEYQFDILHTLLLAFPKMLRKGSLQMFTYSRSSVVWNFSPFPSLCLYSLPHGLL